MRANALSERRRKSGVKSKLGGERRQGSEAGNGGESRGRVLHRRLMSATALLSMASRLNPRDAPERRLLGRFIHRIGGDPPPLTDGGRLRRM